MEIRLFLMTGEEVQTAQEEESLIPVLFPKQQLYHA